MLNIKGEVNLFYSHSQKGSIKLYEHSCGKNIFLNIIYNSNSEITLNLTQKTLLQCFFV